MIPNMLYRAALLRDGCSLFCKKTGIWDNAAETSVDFDEGKL